MAEVRIKTLCLLESVSRADGGIFEAERALQCSLARGREVDVRVVGLRDEFTDADASRWEPLRPKVASVYGPPSIGYAPGLAALLDEDVDLAYAATLWEYPSLAILNWQKKTRKPVVVAPHGSLDVWALNNSRAKKRIAAWLFKNEQLRRASCFRALCDSEADAIRAYGLKQRIEVVPNGVVLPEMRNSKSGTRNGEGSFQGLKQSKRLLFLGRIHPKKGLVGLLRAWAHLKCETGNAKWGEWELVIAGWDQGGHESELKALCGELGLRVFSEYGSGNLKLNSYKLKTPPPEAGGADVIFYGPAFGQEKEELLRSAAAFVLPSFSEGLPMSVLEAWSYGLPVLMTPECHLPEGFACGAALEIQHSQASPTLGDGMRVLIEMSDAELSGMGRHGRGLVERKFTWSQVAAQMSQIYRSLAGR